MVTPRQLDWALNGMPVYIRRRPADGVAYATTYDFSRFIREEPLQVIRVKFDTIEQFRDYNPEKDPRIIRALEKHNAATKAQTG